MKNVLFKNGVLLRSVLDSVTGDMSDTRTRYIGSKPVKLFRILMQGNEAVSKNFVPMTRF
jgi:splicing factor 3B subunit 3